MRDRKGGAGRRVLATVLFTDIVGSTERAEELGNRRWRKLLAQHHELVRRVLKRHKGREIDTAGDGFFAVFTDPGQAVRCACTLVDAVQRLGIQIRAGLHMGECEVADRKVTGIAVHIGSRVLAAAAPSEVLVSGTVRDLLTGSDLRFDDHGSHALKGVAGEWRLFAARPAGPLSQEELDELTKAKTARRRRWAIPVSATAAAVVGGLVSLLVLKPGGTPAGPARSVAAPPQIVDFVAKVDPARALVAGKIKVGRDPVAATAAAGSIWVVNRRDSTVSRIDPVDARVTATIALGKDLVAIAGNDEGVWVVDRLARQVIRIDPGANDVRESISVEGRPNGIAIGNGSLWVAVDGLCPGGAPPKCVPIEAQRIDLQRKEVIDRVPIPGSTQLINFTTGRLGSLDIVSNGTSVWVSTEDGLVTRIDPVKSDVTRQVDLHQPVGSIALAGDSLWVAAYGTPGTAYLFDAATGKRLGTVAAGGGAPPGSFSERTSPIMMTASDDGVWITDGGNGTVAHILQIDLKARPPVRIGDVPMSVCRAFGYVWVAVDGN